MSQGNQIPKPALNGSYGFQKCIEEPQVTKETNNTKNTDMFRVLRLKCILSNLGFPYEYLETLESRVLIYAFGFLGTRGPYTRFCLKTMCLTCTSHSLWFCRDPAVPRRSSVPEIFPASQPWCQGFQCDTWSCSRLATIKYNASCIGWTRCCLGQYMKL